MKDLLSPEEQRFLLKLARDTIEEFLKTRERPLVEDVPKRLSEKRGAFVTLKKRGKLRGCIGYVLPYRPLAETVAEAAIKAATDDPRFLPVEFEELEQLRLEISVLTLPRPIQDINEIEVGRHGIIVSKGTSMGLFLPQVPTEQGWDRETYLRQCCLKGYLPPDAWKEGAQIEVFEAQVFSE